MQRIVLASRNRAKLAELTRHLWRVASVELPSEDISPEGEALEGGPSLVAIARAKAVRWSRALPQELVVATDGGLLIPALGAAWDPLRTRRFAGERTTDRERADALLTLTAGLEGEERRIGWREALAVARNGTVLWSCEADGQPGLLAHDYEPALLDAGGGFWVPALWICPEHGGRRLAELSDAEQSVREDHWALIGERLRRFLAALVPDDHP